MSNFFIKNKEKIVKMFKSSIPTKLEWTILLIVCFLLFISYMYVDILFPTRNGMTFLNVVFNGHLYEFYQYALNTPISSTISSTPTYDVNIYILFAVWNLPLFLLETFSNINIFTSIFALLWAKSILLVFLIGTLYLIYKICLELKITKENAKWCLFIFLSSGFVLSSLFLLCQLDIISIFFSLLGTLMYIKGNIKKFILWFTVAISFKLFALFIFIPLLLLVEKRIIKLFLYILTSISITLIFKIIYFNAPGIEVTKNFTSEMIGFLVANKLNISIGTISLFVFAMILLFAFCYIKKINTTDEIKRYAIYIPFLSYSIFFLFSYTHPYWIILLTPYFSILLFQNMKYLKANLLIEMIASSAMLFTQSIIFFWCFSAKTVSNTIVSKLFPVDSIYNDTLVNYNLTSLTNKINGFDNLLSIPLAIFAAGIVALIVINFPNKNNNFETKETAAIERGLIISRFLLGFGLCLIPLLCYFYVSFK